MPGIYLTALLTTALALGLFLSLWRAVPGAVAPGLRWWAFALALPMQPLAFYLVRVPLDHWIAAHLGTFTSAYPWVASLYAPLTEEPAKLVPLLLLPALRRDLRRENFVRYACALGIGFAIGEMWFIAERVARDPVMAALPFQQFSGYAGERLMTCVFHTAFVSVSLWQFRRHLAAGLLGAMLLHWLGNLPITLMALNLGGLGRANWLILVELWLMFYLVAALGLLSAFAFSRPFSRRFLVGRSRCLACGQELDSSLLRLNFGLRRYERCPHCGEWHWTQVLPS